MQIARAGPKALARCRSKTAKKSSPPSTTPRSVSNITCRWVPGRHCTKFVREFDSIVCPLCPAVTPTHAEPSTWMTLFTSLLAEALCPPKWQTTWRRYNRQYWHTPVHRHNLLNSCALSKLCCSELGWIPEHSGLTCQQGPSGLKSTVLKFCV